MGRLADQLCETLRQHLSGRNAFVPDGGRLVWQWFLDLNRTRAVGLGPCAITYCEIDAYARLYRWPLEPRHVDLILTMDREWLAWARTAGSGDVGTGLARQPKGQPCTPEAFDAVFA